MNRRLATVSALAASGLVAALTWVSTPASAAPTATWTGTTSNLWSVGTNWLSNNPPTTGDALVFPAVASNKSMVNDLGGSYDSIDFQGPAYDITGSALSLDNGITAASTDSISVGITLNGDQTFTETGVTQLVVNGQVDVNGHVLTIANPGLESVRLLGGLAGSGAVVTDNTQASSTVNLGGASSFTGTFTSAYGEVFLEAGSSATSADFTISGGGLSGTGTIGPLHVSGGQVIVGSPPGVMTAGNVTFTGGKLVESLNPNACASLASSGQLAAVGTVNVAGAHLEIAGGGNSQPGQVCTLIDNDGGDAVAGTFVGLPEGALIAANGGVSTDVFQVSYVGGDGNDVTLAAVGGPAFAGAGTMKLAGSTYTVSEASGSVSIKIWRLGGASGSAGFLLQSQNDTASDVSGDFVGISASDSLSDGETQKTFNITINDDAIPESDEDFTVTLGNVTNATLGSPALATVTITDDDEALPPTTSTTTAAGATTTTTALAPGSSTSTTTTTADPPPTTVDPTTTTTAVAPLTNLPRTGSNSPWEAALGVACVAVGTALTRLRRRKAPRP